MHKTAYEVRISALSSVVCSSDLEFAAGGGELLLAPAALAVLGDLAGAALVLHHRAVVACQRRAIEAEHLDRGRRAGFLDLFVADVHPGSNAALLAAGDAAVADPESASVSQNVWDRPVVGCKHGLHDAALSHARLARQQSGPLGHTPDS